jgi:hypothetical protein
MTPPERRNWTGPILEIYANIESWRDFYWRQYLSDMETFHETQNTLFIQYANDSRRLSTEYQRILDTMLDSNPAPQTPGYMDYKYGDFPEDYK